MKPHVLLVVVVFTFVATSAAQPIDSGQASTVKAAFGQLPLYFVENRGIHPSDVRYFIQGADKSLFFTDTGVTFALRGEKRGWAVNLDFIGANVEGRPEGLDRQQAVFSYFTGSEKDWKAGVASYGRLTYRNLWPGVDLVYKGTVNKLKYEFVVAPGVDPSMVRLRYRGASSVAVTDAGALRIETPVGGFEDAPPAAWQEIDAERVPVEMAYSVGRNGRFGFTVGSYDRTRPLVLDPAVLVYCGYIGGTAYDYAWDIDVDALGNAYVTGYTGSSATYFPEKVGPYLTYRGGGDAFVAKVDPTGMKLIYCGYLGGGGYEYGFGIAVDQSGCAYVTGVATSTNMPVKNGPDLTQNGNWDAFVAKVNATGTALEYCGFIGGKAMDIAFGITVDKAGCAYITGHSKSNETTFPVKTGPSVKHSGNSDVFVAKVAADGKSLAFCGYVGGAADDVGEGVRLDSKGNVVLTGTTASDEKSFPVLVGPDLTFNGNEDAFVAKVAASGASLLFCGYIGGNGHDRGQGVALDAADNPVIFGTTSSTEKTFPVLVGPDLVHNGIYDAFLTKVAADGKSLIHSGYFGGANNEEGMDVEVDQRGNMVVCGYTISNEKSFPVRIGPDLTFNGKDDVYVALIEAGAKRVLYCGYIGGTGVDKCFGVAIDGGGSAYVAGSTDSKHASFPVLVGPDLTWNVGHDAWVGKVTFTNIDGGTLSARPGTTVTMVLTATGDVYRAYQAASSLGKGPIPIDTRVIGLSLDPLLAASVFNVLPAIFQGYAGFIGSDGRAEAKIMIPNEPILLGVSIHSAFVTRDPLAPSGVRSISNTYSFTIAP